MSIKILLAEDHHIIREGIRALLEVQKDFEIVAEADDGRTAVKLARQHNPDVIIMDVSMPELNGIDATRQILREINDVKVIALSMYSDKRFIRGMLAAGVSGYLLKNCVAAELISAIRSVMKGQKYLSPQILGEVVEGYLGHLSGNKANRIPRLPLANEKSFNSLLKERILDRSLNAFISAPKQWNPIKEELWKSWRSTPLPHSPNLLSARASPA